ncbi:MAG: translation initiation factor eIF-1A [Candidatus Anstonellales archaeon]
MTGGRMQRGHEKPGYSEELLDAEGKPIPIESRIRFPRGKEIFGVVVSALGGARMMCVCADGKERVCRVPGRLKKHIWVKEGDVVLVEPWQIEGDKKGDIVWRYKPIEGKWLKEKGYINF